MLGQTPSGNPHREELHMSQFPETMWSMINLASSEARTGSREHMGRLLETYWQPMYAHVRYKRVEHQRAEDLVQEFSLQILDNDLLTIADPAKGKFRTLLLTALDRFVVSRFRYETAAKRAPEKSTSLEAAEVDITESEAPPASAAFDRAYALDVIAQVLSKMKEECEASSEEARWNVFEQRVVGPMLDNADVPDYATLAEMYKLKDEKAAMNLLVTAKRQFTRILRKRVQDYVTRNPDLDDYVDLVAKELGNDGFDSTSTRKAATQVTERAVSMAVEEEIDSLKRVLAETRGAGKVEMDQSRASDIYKSGFFMRLNNAEEFSTDLAFGQQSDEDLADDVVFASILDTPLSDVVPGQTHTIREAILGQNDDPTAIVSIKDWANVQRISREPLFSRELATGLYYAAIASALLNHDQRISSQQDAVLARGFDSMIQSEWMDAEVAKVLDSARKQLV